MRKTPQLDVKRLNIIEESQLNGGPVVHPAMAAWVELADTSKVDRCSVLLQWNDKALYIISGGRVIGFLVYMESEWQRSYYIKLGWVWTPLRRQGIYRRLYKHLQKKRDKEKSDWKILGSVHTRNTVMTEIMDALGRDGYSINYIDKP